MKHIIVESNDTEAIVFDVADLAARLEPLPDTRDRRGEIYPLGMILTLVVPAKLAGEDRPSGIAEWIRLRREAFVNLFNHKCQRLPCLNVIRWILGEIVSADALERAFGHYLHETYGGQHSQLVVIDGKTMCGTVPKGHSQGVYLLAAYLPLEGIVLKQVVVDTKENEIVGAPSLIEAMNLENKVVCGDAMHTQRRLSADILGRSGHYIWFLMENQPALLADVNRSFTRPRRRPDFPYPNCRGPWLRLLRNDMDVSTGAR